MRIFDENNVEIESPDLDFGYLKPDRLFVRHHEAVDAVDEVFHYEYTEYPNGGRDRHKIIDVEAVEAVDAWDEYEEIYRYVLFTAKELEDREERRKQTPEYQIAELREALELLLSGVTE